MAKTVKTSFKDPVASYYSQLDHPLKPVVEALRKIILETDSQVAEQIKWNSPAFYYTGDMKPFDPKEYKRDIVVFNLHKKEMVLLVFPTGSTINDTTGLLQGKFKDTRKTAAFSMLEEVTNNREHLQWVIRQWLQLID